MTLWFCDRCGAQVSRIAQGAGKYRLSKTIFEKDKYGQTEKLQRDIRLCDSCSMEMERFLDDEFGQLPKTLTGEIDKKV